MLITHSNTTTTFATKQPRAHSGIYKRSSLCVSRYMYIYHSFALSILESTPLPCNSFWLTEMWLAYFSRNDNHNNYYHYIILLVPVTMRSKLVGTFGEHNKYEWNSWTYN